MLHTTLVIIPLFATLANAETYCYYNSWDQRVCEDRLSTGTRVGIAIAIFVVVFLLFSAFGYKRRQRAKAANLAYINQQPGAQTYPLQQQQPGYSPYPQPNQGPGYFPNQPYPPPNNMYPNNTGGNWGSPAPDHASPALPPPTYPGYAPPSGPPPAFDNTKKPYEV